MSQKRLRPPPDMCAIGRLRKGRTDVKVEEIAPRATATAARTVRRPGAVLQRRNRHRQGRGGFPGGRCRTRRSMSTTTIRPTGPSRSPAPPARWCGGKCVRARATSCGACSPTSMPTSTCWSTATPPTMRRACASMIERLDRGPPRHGGRRPRRSGGCRLSAAAIAPATGCSPAFVANVFGATFTDMLSGYRVFSRRFVKSFPVLSRGFEIETELVVHALGARTGGRRGRDALLFAARKVRSRSSAPGATACASSPPSSISTARSGRWRSSRGSRIALAVVAVGLAIPIFVTYFEEGHRAAAADRRARNRIDAAGVAVGGRGSGARYRDPRPARNEASGLSRAAALPVSTGTGGRSEGDDRCANSCAPTMQS